MDDALEDVVLDIKATIRSSKDRVDINKLNHDYKEICGYNIQFRKFGFNSFEDLIRSVPELRLNRIGNQTFVEVKPDEKTAHITKLVREQKTSKKKSGRSGRPPRRNFNGPPRNNSYGRPTRSYKSTPPRFLNNNSHRFSNYNNKSYSNRNNYCNTNYNNKKDELENKDNVYHDYRSSQPCTYNFSEGEEEDHSFDDPEDYDTPSSEEVEPSFKTESGKTIADNFENLHITVENKNLGVGTSNMRLRGGLKMSNRSYPHRTNYAEDDVGYGSMNENNTDRNKKDKPTSRVPTSDRNISCSKTSPAQILAAGRAANNQKSEVLEHPRILLPVSRVPLHPSRLFDASQRAAFAGGDLPFKSQMSRLVNQPQNRPLFRPPPEIPPPPVPILKPSKMNEDRMFKPSHEAGPLYEDDTRCQELFAFAMKYKLGYPEFSNFEKTDARNVTWYMCKLKIHGLTFPSEIYQDSSLPNVHEHAAEEALRELKKQYENNGAIFDTATEKAEIIIRITEIVSKHPTGLKSEFIELKFKDMYKEKLPRNWLEIIKSQSLLSVETLVGGIFVYPPQDIGACMLSINKLPPLVLPEIDMWNVFVTTCISTNYVYFRLVGEEYDAKYDQMAQAMEDIYKNKENAITPAEPIKEGNYYAACLQGQWYRVKVLSSDLGDKYRVALVDHGDTEEVLSEFIFPLSDELTDLPAQAIRCSLTGLEKYHNNDYVTEIICAMTTDPLRALVARVDSRNPHCMLTLFDTSTDEDINLNEQIGNKIEKELSQPKIPKESNLGDVYLTKVEEDGRAHVQIISEGLKLLMSFMADVKRDMAKHEERYRLKSRGNLVGGKTVLAKYEGDQMWHRAVVVSLLNRDQMAEVRFIDYGNTEIVSIEHIAELKHFSNVLTAIPPQAVEVQLIKATGELFTQSVIEFLMSLAQTCDDDGAISRLFLMKVIKSDHVPVVELFLRDDRNQVVRLNDIIGSYYPDYRSENFKDVKLNLASIVSQKQKSSRYPNDISKTFTTIPPFNIPSTGSLPVYVSMIINPGYFVVQPLDYLKELHKMTEDMNEYYSKSKPVVEIESIVCNNAFAIQNEEKKWCRGLVIRVAKDLDGVSLYCVDYGNIVNVDFKSVYMLMPCFRKLPALAIKAELAGIAPILNNGWSMHDCIRFHELMSKREFVSVIVEATEDTVSLMLYDTSGEIDVNIGAILVEEGRATDVTAS